MTQSRSIWTRLFGGDNDESETDRIDALQAALAITQDEMAALRQDVRKLGKAQYKANTLVEGQAARWEATATKLAETQAENTRLVQEVAQQTHAWARRDLLQALLPAIDGIDQAFLTGYRYLQQRDLEEPLRELWPTEQQPLMSAQDRAALAAWLKGLRVVRERLLTVLATDGVTRIRTIGEQFDPYLHVAVGTVSAEAPAAENIIASEQKAGYRFEQGILRYAEVVVKKYTESTHLTTVPTHESADTPEDE